MATTPTLEPAAAGDRLTLDDLDVAFRFLMAQAEALDADVASAPDVPTQQRIGRLQNDLFERAAALNAKSIDLLAGEARITAAHIDSAVAAAQAVIDKVADLEARLTALGAVLVFFGAVSTGHGGSIVKSARALKEAFAGPGGDTPQAMA